MFFHNFKYALKKLFNDKMLIFWTFVFPLVLGTCFYFAFSNIEKGEMLSVIDIAIVNNEEFTNNEIYKESFKSLSSDTDNKLFNITYTSESDAKNLLEKNKISGYLILKEEPVVVISENGIESTVLKQVVEEINDTSNMIDELVASATEDINDLSSYIDYKNIYLNALNSIKNDVEIKDISSPNLSYTMIEFYTLIAMVCLYGGTLGMTAINSILANMSKEGKRVSITPASKIKLVTSSFLAAYIVQLIGVALLFIYTIFFLNVDYGNNFGQIILIILFGSLAGLSIGVVIASLFKINEGAKVGLIIAISMLGSFFSGMMGITMKYVIDTNLPIINLINPANMITDGLYALYYYDTFNRFNFNILSLIIFSFIMLFISLISLRRQKYDYI